jgi:hypothetical protein
MAVKLRLPVFRQRAGLEDSLALQTQVLLAVLGALAEALVLLLVMAQMAVARATRVQTHLLILAEPDQVSFLRY